MPISLCDFNVKDFQFLILETRHVSELTNQNKARVLTGKKLAKGIISKVMRILLL